MKGYNILKTTLAALLLIMATLATGAWDLPIVKIGKHECFCYEVGESETLYAVAHKLGIGRAEIVRYNPAAADGVRKGQKLYFPVESYPNQREVKKTTADKPEDSWREANRKAAQQKQAEAEPDVNPAQRANTGLVEIPPVEQESNQLTPVNLGRTQITPDENTDDVTKQLDEQFTDDEAQVTEEDSYNHPDTAIVALVMPFMLDEEKVSRQASLVTDFYRGFLIAADTLSAQLPPLQLLVYDTRGNTERLRNYLALEKRLPKASLIIAPDNSEHLEIIGQFGRDNNVPVLNYLAVKDSLYYTNPMVMQGNVSSPVMTDKAIRAFVDACTLENLTPVILQVTEGQNDKQAFVDQLVEAMRQQGLEPRMIDGAGSLTADMLTERIGEPTGASRFLVIPTGGAYTSFVKYAPALARYKENVLAQGGELRLAGYPEWITFRADALDWLHALDSTIYSRFAYDPSGYDMQGVNSAFRHWYGKDPVDGVPSQAIMGFDTGCFVLNNIIRGNRFASPDMSSWRGVQSTFDFKREPEHAGMVNNAVYLVRYMPGGTFDINVL